MAIQPVFNAVVERGRLRPRDETAYNAFLWKLKDGEEVRLKITRKHKERSTNQNAWYWGVVLPVISHETGHTPEELHEIFKRMFCQSYIVSLKGKNIRLPGSTSTMSTAEFSEFVERVRAYAATELGLMIPDPE